MKYSRILIKLSGEMLGSGGGFSYDAASQTAAVIAEAVSTGVEIAVLVGGGNIMRARESGGLDRISADYMGMTATIINALGLKSVLAEKGIGSRIMSAIDLQGVTEPVDIDSANRYLAEKNILIFAGGTGSPFVTTDTAAALRALAIEAQAILKATKVDGVYTADPDLDENASFIPSLTYEEVIEKDLKVIDRSAVSILAGHPADNVRAW